MFRKKNLKNFLECFKIILMNNEEILIKKVEQVKTQDFELRKKELILSKIKNNNLDDTYNINLINTSNNNYEKMKESKLN